VLEDMVRATCRMRGGGGLLLIKPPQCAKSTLLGDVVHMLSEAMDREVVIVDTRWEGLQPGRPLGMLLLMLLLLPAVYYCCFSCCSFTLPG
jgi:hypothetical protein